jgi:hypothetical protein
MLSYFVSEPVSILRLGDIPLFFSFQLSEKNPATSDNKLPKPATSGKDANHRLKTRNKEHEKSIPGSTKTSKNTSTLHHSYSQLVIKAADSKAKCAAAHFTDPFKTDPNMHRIKFMSRPMPADHSTASKTGDGDEQASCKSKPGQCSEVQKTRFPLSKNVRIREVVGQANFQPKIEAEEKTEFLLSIDGYVIWLVIGIFGSPPMQSCGIRCPSSVVVC